MKIETVNIPMAEAASIIDEYADNDRRTDLPHLGELRHIAEGNEEDEVPQWVQDLGGEGLIWEAGARKLAAAWADEEGYTFVPQMVLEHEGVICSTDGILIPHDDRQRIVAEFKMRFAKPHPPDRLFRWMWQSRGYMKAAETTTTLMWVKHFYMDSGPKVAIQRHRIDYLRSEIEESWQAVQGAARIWHQRRDERATAEYLGDIPS